MPRKTPEPAPSITATTTLLELLQQGASVTFPGEYTMRGLPHDRDIQVATQFGSEGLWNLDAEGVGNAADDLAKLAAQNGYDLAGRRIGEPQE
jgi:hypothetical protein